MYQYREIVKQTTKAINLENAYRLILTGKQDAFMLAISLTIQIACKLSAIKLPHAVANFPKLN